MNAAQQLHDAGQSLWLDNITRDLLDGGTLQRYVDDGVAAFVASWNALMGMIGARRAAIGGTA